MFLDFLKSIFTQKMVRKRISDSKYMASDQIIKTVGIIFDESYFYEKDEMVSELIARGIEEKDIRILVFKDKIKKNEVFDYPTFSRRDLSWAASLEKSEVREFVTLPFDLLINYYDMEKPALMLVTNQSKAAFKVGFSSIDKKLNHFMINTNAENFKVFIEELFKYLKILNKI